MLGLKKPYTPEEIAHKHHEDKEFIANQLLHGTDVEMEHTKDKIVAQTIASQHLWESARYYIELAKMESNLEGGGEVLGIRGFYADYIHWYKPIANKINIFISIPNEYSTLITENKDSDIILNVFEKIDQSIDAKKYLKQLVSIANRNKVGVWLEPVPRYKYVSDEKKHKITREYLIQYYKKFGFKLMPNGFMYKKPNE